MEERFEAAKAKHANRKEEINELLSTLEEREGKEYEAVEERNGDIGVAEGLRDEHRDAGAILARDLAETTQAYEAVRALSDVVARTAPKVAATIEILAEKRGRITELRGKVKESEAGLEALAESISGVQRRLEDARRRISDAEATLPTLEESKKAFVRAKNFKQAGAMTQKIRDLKDAKEKDEKALAACDDEMKSLLGEQQALSAEMDTAQSDLALARASMNDEIKNATAAGLAPEEKDPLYANSYLSRPVVRLLLDVNSTMEEDVLEDKKEEQEADEPEEFDILGAAVKAEEEEGEKKEENNDEGENEDDDILGAAVKAEEENTNSEDEDKDKDKNDVVIPELP